MKRRGRLRSCFAPKTKVGEIQNKQLSKVDGQDEADEERRGRRKESTRERKAQETETEIEHQTKATRERSKWEKTTAVKIWRRASPR